MEERAGVSQRITEDKDGQRKNKVNQINHKSLPEKTADVISDMIYSNRYCVGSKLPNEIELAAMLEVSRNTVRAAVRILSERNVLEVRRGSGTFVSAKLGLSDDPLGLSLVCDKKKFVRDLLQVRLMIEPRMASMAAEYANASEIRHLEGICARAEAAYGLGDNYYEYDMEFHTWIASLSGNMVIHNLLKPIHQAILLQESVTDRRMGMRTLEGHRRICAAIAGHRCNDAFDAMTAHLIQNQERLLEISEDGAMGRIEE